MLPGALGKRQWLSPALKSWLFGDAAAAWLGAGSLCSAPILIKMTDFSVVLDVSLIQRYMLSTGNHIKIYISFIHHNLTQACRFVSFFSLCLGTVLGLGISALWNTEKWSDSCRGGCAAMEQLQEELWGSEQSYGHLVCSCHWKSMWWVNYRFVDVQYWT